MCQGDAMCRWSSTSATMLSTPSTDLGGAGERERRPGPGTGQAGRGPDCGTKVLGWMRDAGAVVGLKLGSFTPCPMTSGQMQALGGCPSCTLAASLVTPVYSADLRAHGISVYRRWRGSVECADPPERGRGSPRGRRGPVPPATGRHRNVDWVARLRNAV